jgi:hypothetical protein
VVAASGTGTCRRGTRFLLARRALRELPARRERQARAPVPTRRDAGGASLWFGEEDAMPNEKTPRTQTSAPVEPAETTEDVPRRAAEGQPWPPRHQHTPDEAVRGDEMPMGADEPGAGL